MAIRFKPENQSRRDFLKWWWWRFLITFFILWAAVMVVYPLAELCALGWNETGWNEIRSFYAVSIFENVFYPFQIFFKWLWAFISSEPRHLTWGSFFAWKLVLIPLALFVWAQLFILSENPHRFTPQTFGTGREATVSDIKAFGLADGQYLLMGMLNGVKMKLPDPRSIFCIGAPGSGKTAGVVIPAVLEGKNMCMIINDPKGEIARATSGYRATLGPVFKMNWAGIDNPEKGIFWPSWNPLGGKNLPPLHAGREGYIDDLIYFLIADGPEGTDPYWVKSGRGCLTGLTGYLCGKVEQAKANDYFLARLSDGALDEADYQVLISYYQSMRDFPEVKFALEKAQKRQITMDNYLPIGKWGMIPESWRGADACFAMLLDIINEAQFQLNLDIKKRQAEGDVAAMNTDAWKELFDEIVLETAYYGYGRRTLLELSQVAALPDKQRASVISMALGGINIFKNSAVRARTSFNDFNYEDLRGVRDEKTGTWKPVTIYMSVPLQDLNSSMQISTLFINMATAYLMENGPKQGNTGPYPMAFMLDEFQHMPPLQSITDGIVFGRGKSNMFLVSVQDWHQISTKYSGETANVIMSSAAVKIIKRQNNPETRNPLLKGIAPLTKVVHSYKTKEKGFMPIFERTHSVKTQSDTVIGGSGVLSMKNEKQVVLYAGHLHRPISAQTPLFFKKEGYKKLAAMEPAPNMPKELIQHRFDEGTDAILNMQVMVDQ